MHRSDASVSGTIGLVANSGDGPVSNASLSQVAGIAVPLDRSLSFVAGLECKQRNALAHRDMRVCD